MIHIWFKPWGCVFRPVSAAGWLATALALAFCAQVILAGDHHSHSVSDTLYRVFPYLASSFILLNWLASKTSSPPTPASESGTARTRA